jgi:4-amino-4-deoxy-L-arabinose transferase-like glycosyltransferase
MRAIRLPSTPLKWLLASAIFHVIVAIIAFCLGHFSLMPALFDHDGLTIGLAFDNTIYRALQLELVQTLHSSGWQAWLDYQSPLHARLYSLCFAFFGKLFGYNILATEPLNLFYFLATLTFVYLLGRTIFNARAGLLAAIITALWPSMLLQSMQMVRDPLSNMCLLSLIWLLVVIVAVELTWQRGLLLVFGIVLTIALLWMARGNIWSIVVIALAATLSLLVVKMIVMKRVVTTNAVALVIVIAAALVIPTQIESTSLQDRKTPMAALSLQSAGSDMGPFTRLVKQIGNRRAAFHQGFAAKGSNIDADVSLLSVGDIFRYLPRAMAIGCFAPFPNMWFQAGSEVGRSGRLASGLEMVLMYLIYAAALVTLFFERKRLSMWLIFTVALAGMVGLGLIVANVGALYRLRYSFWIMLIVIGAQGLLIIEKRWIAGTQHSTQ